MKNSISRTRSSRLNFETKLLLLALFISLPSLAAVCILLWTGDFSTKLRWTIVSCLVLFALWMSFRLRERVVIPLQTLSNILAGLREEDYSIRASGAGFNGALAELMYEVNALGETLRQQRMGSVDAITLLRTVMAEIDVAVFTFDASLTLRLVNRAGERLLAATSEQIVGKAAGTLGLAECLLDTAEETITLSLPGGSGRWAVRRSTFREGGVPHQLLLLTDLSRTLRGEERLAWQRLVRVLGHELNNSLTPIKSIAGSLAQSFNQDPKSSDWQEDMHRGLEVIASRADALSRFMQAYSRLARLPQPIFKPINVREWVESAMAMETRMPLKLHPGPEVTIQGDRDQLDQLLINLIRNAVDASLATGGAVFLGWEKLNNYLDVCVLDEGIGLADTSNLFVPFFTTKPGGSGIGLALSRQIAEAHFGDVSLENRPNGTGCIAHLRLPT